MMKKAIKKLLAALLAVAMVCAMAIPAFAENRGGTCEPQRNPLTALSRSSRVILRVRTIRLKISDVDWGSNTSLNLMIFLDNLKERSYSAKSLKLLPNLLRKFLRLSANGIIPMITASLLRVLYAAISTRMQRKTEPVVRDHTDGINIPRPSQVII